MKEYDMADLERAGDGWFSYMMQQKEMKDHVLERLEIARHPSGWWPRVARVMLHGELFPPPPLSSHLLSSLLLCSALLC